MELAKCYYCPTVYHIKDEDDENCPMCGSIPERVATQDDIKRAKMAECLRDDEGHIITDDALKVLGIDSDSLGRERSDDDGFYFQCSSCGERVVIRYRFITKDYKDICSTCLAKKGYFTVGRSTPDSEDSIKFGRKMMEKGKIPEGRTLLVMSPNPAEDLQNRLDIMWEERGQEPLYSYYVANYILIPPSLGVRPERSEVTVVLVVEDLPRFFNLQLLEPLLDQKPRIKVTNVCYAKGRIEIFLKYIDKPPKYIFTNLRRVKPLYREKK
ncbi:MAG: hypothetical protein ACW98U_16320 [Candidatus Thorarchaeota archaeon]|jgi:hypothetical protein